MITISNNAQNSNLNEEIYNFEFLNIRHKIQIQIGKHIFYNFK